MQKHTCEYEIIADANFIGEYSSDNVSLVLWDFGVHRRGEKRLLCLRLEHNQPSPDIPAIQAREFITLASLFLRKRLILGQMTRFDNSPRRHPASLMGSHKYVDGDIVRDDTNLQELLKWLPLMKKLEGDKRDKFILAARFYSEALEHIESNPDISYLNLVSAIECLSQEIDIKDVNLSEIDTGLAEAVEKIEPPALRVDISNRIINREHFNKRKFIAFITQNIDESFWSYKWRCPEPSRIHEDDLERLLSNIYNQRSRTLHTGEQFPEYIFLSSGIPSLEELPEDVYLNKQIKVHWQSMEEIPIGEEIGVKTSIGERWWKRKDYIPYPHFFERLVNHVLKNYLFHLTSRTPRNIN